jgi:HAD superfamily hydrolase (TIGR01459 family)
MSMLPGFAPLAPRYRGFIVDLWGVVHDGITPFPGALDCLKRLAGQNVLLLSNAPRRAESVRGTLRRLGVADRLYTHILTSGEATWQALRDRSDPWFASLGTRAYHLGPPRDRGVLDGVGVTLAGAPGEADFVLNTGPDDERDSEGIGAFTGELRACLDARLPMICANPDLEIVRGDRRILCAGTFAAWYEAQGGEVCWIGKPAPAIYESALAMLGLEPAEVLAIGDSLRTDIAGAAASGLDSVWVLGGIHAAEMSAAHGDPAAAARAAGAAPNFILDRLAW